MIDSIKKNIKLNFTSLWGGPLTVVALFVLGHIILLLVMAFDKDATTFEFGTAMALASMIFISLFGGIGYHNSFNYALCMSQKRSGIITSMIALSLIKTTISVVVLFLLNKYERFMCDTSFGDRILESNMSAIFKPQFMILIILAFVALEGLLGSLYTKFGPKFFWVTWVATIILMQLPGKIVEAVTKEDFSHFLKKFAEFCMNGNGNIIFALAVCVLLLLIALPYLLLRKQRVTI